MPNQSPETLPPEASPAATRRLGRGKVLLAGALATATALAGAGYKLADGVHSSQLALVAPHTEFGTTGLKIMRNKADSARALDVYNYTTPDDGPGVQQLRVLRPTDPKPGVAHNFLFVLPVAPGVDNTDYGDGLDTLQKLDAQNKYNLTIIEPSFSYSPWYANNPDNPDMQYETFMTEQLVPWAQATLSTTGQEQNWLIGFSKSGIGGLDLLLKHPKLFAVGASWDFPADMTSYDGADQDAGTVGGGPAANYGTQANFVQSYELSPANLHKWTEGQDFDAVNRVWIGGYAAFKQDDAEANLALSAAHIQHTTATAQTVHRWDSGWVPGALAGLYEDSLRISPAA